MYGRKTNRERLTGGKKYAQKQAAKFGVDEVVFNKESRVEYLTGFHKRKLERQKNAQEYIKEQERLARLEERKKIREDRKKDLEKQMKRLKETVSDISAIREEVENKDGTSNSDEDDEWTGFGESPSENGVSEDTLQKHATISEEEKKENGILQHTEIYNVADDASEAIPEEIDDEDPEDVTTVTVESLESPAFVAASKVNLEEIAKANNVSLEKSEEVLEDSIKRAKKYAIVCGVAKPKYKEKGPKKKFRYLTKAERRENTRKERTKNKKPRS